MDNDYLTSWQHNGIDKLREETFVASTIHNVTVIAYYFKDELNFSSNFWRTEFAFLKTFQTQGILPAVLVTNNLTTDIESFCDKFSIEIQIAKNLIPGQLKSLAIDLIQNLHSRFNTQYVLTIQDDGFPLRPGLENFIGKWDYIGAPWVKHATYYDLYPSKYNVGNGGFSLRSKRLCEVASNVYKRWFRHAPYWWYILGDDTFYCKTLRFWFRSAIHDMRWPTLQQAAEFSIECNEQIIPTTPPLGFHKEGFTRYMTHFSKESILGIQG